MQTFMNALYNAAGSTVTGIDGNFPFTGKIAYIRENSGGELEVIVELMEDCGYAKKGETICFFGSEFYKGASNFSSKLRVHFDQEV